MEASDLLSPNLGHVRSLDGVRAIAVLLVVAYHTSYGHPTGGYLGVDIFFVLSGYLITTLLLDEAAHSGDIALTAFYVRRARRLLPALLAAIALGALIIRLVPSAAGTLPYPVAVSVTLLYVGNWLPVGGLGPLQVTWSLAVEEQFYLLWPVVVRARVRRGAGAADIGRVALALCGACFVVGVIFRFAFGWDVYANSVPRFSELMVGCTLGCGMKSGMRASIVRWATNLPAVACASAVVGATALFVPQDAKTLFLGQLLLVSACVALVVAHCVVADSRLTRVLEMLPLVFVGQISYGLYLYHLPVSRLLTSGRIAGGTAVVVAARVAVTFAVATLSFYVLERPVRRRRNAASLPSCEEGGDSIPIRSR